MTVSQTSQRRKLRLNVKWHCKKCGSLEWERRHHKRYCKKCRS